MQTISISLPERVNRRLEHAAASARKPIHELAAQSVQESLPPLLDTIPARYEHVLRAMENLDDDDLWSIARSSVEERSQRQLRRLLKKNRLGTLTATERKTLTDLRSSVDAVMLRKAYAFLLLKWRGHRIPSLAELARTQGMSSAVQALQLNNEDILGARQLWIAVGFHPPIR